MQHDLAPRGKPLPLRYWHVRWLIATDEGHPSDRTQRQRSFTRPGDAGAQVRALLAPWAVRLNAELLGVWWTSGHDEDGLVWTQVPDPMTLTVGPDIEAKYDALEAAHAGLFTEVPQDD